MKNIALIGTGIMGYGMAANLLKAGYNVVVWNRTKEKALPLVELGATIAESAQNVVQDTDVIITMLSADAQVKEIVLGEEGIIHKIKENQLVIDSSTVSPATSNLLYEQLQLKGAAFLDAPVTGSAPQANDGSLGFIVGGDVETYESALPLFEAMGKSAIYMGLNGSGATTKLINNVMASLSLLSFTEGIALAKKSNLDLNKFVDVISGGGAYNRMVDMKKEKMIQEDFSPQFSAKLMHKDLGLAEQLAQSLQVNAQALSLSKQLFQRALDEGFGDEDISSLLKLYEQK